MMNNENLKEKMEKDYAKLMDIKNEIMSELDTISPKSDGQSYRNLLNNLGDIYWAMDSIKHAYDFLEAKSEAREEDDDDDEDKEDEEDDNYVISPYCGNRKRMAGFGSC